MYKYKIIKKIEISCDWVLRIQVNQRKKEEDVNPIWIAFAEEG